MAACALFLCLAGGASASSVSSSAVRATAAAVQRDLQVATTFPDRRIVSNASCVGLSGVYRGADELSSNFACLVTAWHKPPATSAALWARLGSAIRTGNAALLYQLLGLPSTATPAQVNAAGYRVMGRAVPTAAGVVVVDSAHVRLTASPIATAAFIPSWNARHALLGVVPALEAYYYDHNTYAGVTTTRLVAAPYRTPVPASIRIVSAKSQTYCLEARAAGTTWSVHGPGGAPVLATCA